MIFLEIDPNIVKPGWTPLLITIAIAAVMVFGFFSMRRQFRRINVPGDPGRPATGVDEPGSDPEPTDVAAPVDGGRPSTPSTSTPSASPPG